MSRERSLETIMALALGLIVLGFRFSPKLIWAAAVVMAVTLLSPAAAIQIARFWIQLVKRVGTVISHAVLSVIFFTVVTPLSLVYRATHTPQKNGPADSYFHIREHNFTKADFERMW